MAARVARCGRRLRGDLSVEHQQACHLDLAGRGSRRRRPMASAWTQLDSAGMIDWIC
jgi:hypothetical protein